MITEARADDLMQLEIQTEAAVKIAGWASAYGWDRPFMRIWKTDHNGLIACMGREALAAVEPEDEEETALFLLMQPAVQAVRADPGLVRLLAAARPGRTQRGAVMRLITPATAAGIMEPPPLNEVYRLLTLVFDDTLPPWEDWYVDVSHRLRHGCCRIAGVVEADGLAAVAMTTAECGSAALIGGVATHPAFRRRGYARRCVMSVAAALQEEGKDVWLSPKNETARQLYSRWGFIEAGEWAAITWEDV